MGSKRRRRTVAALAASVVAGCAVAAAPSAQAADGDLYIDGCLARTAVASVCAAGLPGGLPTGAAVSPDGNHIYVSVEASGAAAFTGLQIFDRNPQTGVVAARGGPGGCFVASGGPATCTRVPSTNSPNASYDVAVSPDGRNVYYASFATGGLLNFGRDPASGSLTYVNCVGNGNGCTPLTAGLNVESVASSPDSRNVYARTGNGLAVLDRNPDTLALAQKPTFSGCFHEGNVANCTDVDGLAGHGYTIAASPDGLAVYTAFESPGGVAVFKRAPDGTLSQTTGPAGGCVSANGNSGGTGTRCQNGNDGLVSAWSVAVSPDSGSIYVGGAGGLTTFSRNAATAELTQTGCFGGAGCTPVPVGIGGVFDVDVTPGGGEVIAAVHSSETVVSFQRDPLTGTLVQRPGTRGCLSRTGNGTACLPLALINNDYLMRLAMDPSSLRFYLTGRAGMLATITRDFTPVCSPMTVAAPFNTAISVPLQCGDLNGDATTLEKVGLPAAGQLGEIINGAVFYNPFGNFVGADAFNYRGVTPSRGAAGAPATITVNVAAPAATPGGPTPLPRGIDNDKDGFFAGQDCNDANAAIRPGAVEVKGNNLDENCDGTAEPFPTLSSGVVSKWDVNGTRLTLTTLQVTQQFPRGWKAKILCKGPRCTFRSKALKAGKVRRGPATIIASLSRSQRRFRAGQTVEVWLSAPGFNTKVARFVLRRNRVPTTQPFCVLPGQTRVQRTCT